MNSPGFGTWAGSEPAAYDASMDRLNPSVAQRAADVSGALTPRTAELATEIYDLIVREIPLLRSDKQVLTLLEASVGLGLDPDLTRNLSQALDRVVFSNHSLRRPKGIKNPRPALAERPGISC